MIIKKHKNKKHIWLNRLYTWSMLISKNINIFLSYKKNKAEILINPKISALYFFNYLRIYYKIPFKYIQLLFNSYCANKSRTRNRWNFNNISSIWCMDIFTATNIYSYMSRFPQNISRLSNRDTNLCTCIFLSWWWMR